MGARGLFISIALCMAASIAILRYMPPDKLWMIYPVLGLALIALAFLYRRIVMPSMAASRGLELIASQDFNNFLAKVGEKNADKVVTLFNQIIGKLREERLKNMEQENFLHLLIEASPMGVVLLDFDERVTMTNRSFLSITGIDTADSASGKAIGSLPSDLAPDMASVPLGQSKVISRGDMRMWRCYHLSFVQTGFKRHFYLLESLTEEVREAQRKAYEKVIRTMSHEVNNTMGGVLSILGIIHDTTKDSEVKEVIESCSDRCDKMCSFISSYADVVRLPEPVKRKVDLAAQLRKLMPFLQEIAGERIEMSIETPPEGAEVELDMPLMQQAIVNIVKNAAESIADRGAIDIKLSKHKRSIELEIANDGAPIADDVSRQLFTPFFTTKREGRGLGLTLIGDILKKHGATFRLSTGPDAITRFRIVM